jgi:hypothetical protein
MIAPKDGPLIVIASRNDLWTNFVVEVYSRKLFLAFHLVVTKVPRKLQRFAIVGQALRLDSGGR